MIIATPDVENKKSAVTNSGDEPYPVHLPVFITSYMFSLSLYSQILTLTTSARFCSGTLQGFLFGCSLLLLRLLPLTRTFSFSAVFGLRLQTGHSHLAVCSVPLIFHCTYVYILQPLRYLLFIILHVVYNQSV